MEAGTLDSKEIQSIEQIRQRLNTLKTILLQYQRHFIDPNFNPDLIPTWPTITTIHKALAANLTALQRQMSDTEEKQLRDTVVSISSNNMQFLKEAHPHPTSQFPYSAQDALGMIMRKKLTPEITNWQRQMRNLGIAIEDDTICDVKGYEWDDFWKWATGAAARALMDSVVGGDESDEDEDEDKEDDSSSEEDREEEEQTAKNDEVKETAPAMVLNDLMSFASVGIIPQPKPGLAGQAIRR